MVTIISRWIGCRMTETALEGSAIVIVFWFILRRKLCRKCTANYLAMEVKGRFACFTNCNMIRSAHIKDRRDLDSFLGFKGVLASCRKAMNSTVHATAHATPKQLVFGRDEMLNASFQADWQFIKERKQRRIIQNNKCENAKRKPHTCNVGNVVVVKAGAGRKHGSNRYLNSMRITQVNDNSTVKLS